MIRRCLPVPWPPHPWLGEYTNKGYHLCGRYRISAYDAHDHIQFPTQQHDTLSRHSECKKDCSYSHSHGTWQKKVRKINETGGDGFFMVCFLLLLFLLGRVGERNYVTSPTKGSTQSSNCLTNWAKQANGPAKSENCMPNEQAGNQALLCKPCLME